MMSDDPTARGTVLVADDSRTIRRIVELTLRDAGFAVTTAEDGGAALAELRAGEFSVVLADVAMPGPSGYELSRRVKTSSRPVPVLLLVGSFEALDEERARRCGADGWLVKPFEPGTLRSRIEELLALESPASADPDEAEELTVRATPPGDASAADGPARPPAPAGGSALEPAPELVEAVTRAVVARLSDRVLREVAREIVPELAARIIRERLAELERE